MQDHPNWKKLLKISFFEKLIGKNKFENKILIKDIDEDSEVVSISKIGITQQGQGAVILKTENGAEFPISSFSPSTAKCISDFREGKLNEMPTVYNMVEQICENQGIFLVKVRIYQSGKTLRANLYFKGVKDLILRNYLASDAMALATLYSIPILVKKELIKPNPEIKY